MSRKRKLQQQRRNKFKNKRVIFLFFTNKINLLTHTHTQKQVIIFKEIRHYGPFISKQVVTRRSLSKQLNKNKQEH